MLKSRRIRIPQRLPWAARSHRDSERSSMMRLFSKPQKADCGLRSDCGLHCMIIGDCSGLMGLVRSGAPRLSLDSLPRQIADAVTSDSAPPASRGPATSGHPRRATDLGARPLPGTNCQLSCRWPSMSVLSNVERNLVAQSHVRQGCRADSGRSAGSEVEYDRRFLLAAHRSQHAQGSVRQHDGIGRISRFASPLVEPGRIASEAELAYEE